MVIGFVWILEPRYPEDQDVTREQRDYARKPANKELHLTACLLRARRCRALAARTAAGELHVRLSINGVGASGIGFERFSLKGIG